MSEDDYEYIPNSSVTTNMLAGALAGITEHSVMYPIDNIKTRMQMIQSNKSLLYSGITNAISRISTTEGMYALWKGVSSVIVGAGPSHALYFATYEQCKESFGVTQDDHHHLATGAAGACATIVADAFMNPFDVIKQRMQLSTAANKNVYQCGLSILGSEGVSAFYVSYPTTLIMNIPFQSIHFMTYEYFCRTLNPSGAYDPKTHIISGGLAGAIASAVTNPLDVVKTLLQTRGTSTESHIRKVDGFINGAKIVYSHHGMSGFAKGLTPRVLANMPATAISWTTVRLYVDYSNFQYEFLKHFINSNKTVAEQ